MIHLQLFLQTVLSYNPESASQVLCAFQPIVEDHLYELAIFLLGMGDQNDLIGALS